MIPATDGANQQQQYTACTVVGGQSPTRKQPRISIVQLVSRAPFECAAAHRGKTDPSRAEYCSWAATAVIHLIDIEWRQS